MNPPKTEKNGMFPEEVPQNPSCGPKTTETREQVNTEASGFSVGKTAKSAGAEAPRAESKAPQASGAEAPRAESKAPQASGAEAPQAGKELPPWLKEKKHLPKWARVVLVHFFSLCAVAFLVWFGCPFQKIFGAPCPFCGTSRAWLAMLQGDLQTALSYHMLFFLVPPYLLLLLHMGTPLWKRHKKAVWIAVIAMTVIFLLYHILRIYWIIPSAVFQKI